jgi:hypothetical protein
MQSRFRAAPVAAIALILVLALAVIGCGNAGSTGITYQFEAGDSYSYVMNIGMSGTVSGPSMDDEQVPEGTSLEARFTLEVTDVEDGIATVVYRYDSLKMTAEGQTESLPANTIPSVTMQVDSEGRIVSVDGGNAGMPFGMGMSELPFDPSQFGAQMTVVTPEGGLGEIGDEWTATNTMPIPGTGQEVTTTVKATLVGLDTVDGQTLATIDYTLDVPMDIEIDLAEMMRGVGLEQMMDEMGDDFAFKMTMAGLQTMAGTTKINMSKGVPVSFAGDVSMVLEFGITEAPEDMIPAEERGPFGMDMKLKITLDQVQ